MHAESGVLRNEFALPRKGSPHEQFGLAAERFPINYGEIREALAKDRDDLPNMNEFVKYCSRMDPANISPEESEIETSYTDFLDPHKWHQGQHRNGRHTLLLQPGVLPMPPDTIKPDLCMGISPARLQKRVWVGKHLPGYARNGLLICINSVVEHKSSEGSIITAVSGIFLPRAYEKYLILMFYVSANSKSSGRETSLRRLAGRRADSDRDPRGSRQGGSRGSFSTIGIVHDSRSCPTAPLRRRRCHR